MTVPLGSRELHMPGTFFNPDGRVGKVLWARLDEPFTDTTVPSLDERLDGSWMRLSPVPVGHDGWSTPIGLATKVPDHVLRRRQMRPSYRLEPPPEPGDLVYTLGPFKGERFASTVRAFQGHRRMSLTLAGEDGDDAMRYRFFDVQVALHDEDRLLHGPAYWLDWITHPVGEHGETAVHVHKPIDPQRSALHHHPERTP